jgi:hypothetical protein
MLSFFPRHHRAAEPLKSAKKKRRRRKNLHYIFDPQKTDPRFYWQFSAFSSGEARQL